MFLNRLSISKLPAIYFDGEYRVLACLPPTQKYNFRQFSSVRAVLPESEWVETDMEHFNLPILNQGSTSSCTGHGGCSGMEMAWVKSGNDLINFSPWFLYGLVNNGRDAGAAISDVLSALQSTGICPDADVPHGVMFRNQFPQKAFTDASQYKVLEALQCNSFEEICSAISTGDPVPLGLLVGDNFPNLDSNGIAPLPAGGGGGHCVLGMGLKKSPRYGWLIKIQNSWGASFGLNGHCYLRQQSLQYMQPDAFAIQSMTDNNSNVPPATNMKRSK